MLEKIGDENYLNRVCISDKSTFYVSGKFNHHKVRIWCWDSPKLNVWFGLLHDILISPFFFVEKIANGDVYQDPWSSSISLSCALFHNCNICCQILFQQNDALPYWICSMYELLNSVFLEKWIGCEGYISWSLQWFNITPLDFFLWDYVKDRVYQTPVSDIYFLKKRKQLAIFTVIPQMLKKKNIWKEIKYRLDTWLKIPLKNNFIRCKKLATIVSAQKNVAQPFFRKKQVSTSAEI